MFMLGSTALNAIQGNQQQKRQSAIDETDALWSGFAKPSGYKAAESAPWIKDLQSMGSLYLGSEMKDPGQYDKANKAFEKLLGLGKKEGSEIDPDLAGYEYARMSREGI